MSLAAQAETEGRNGIRKFEEFITGCASLREAILADLAELQKVKDEKKALEEENAKLKSRIETLEGNARVPEEPVGNTDPVVVHSEPAEKPAEKGTGKSAKKKGEGKKGSDKQEQVKPASAEGKKGSDKQEQVKSGSKKGEGKKAQASKEATKEPKKGEPKKEEPKKEVKKDPKDAAKEAAIKACIKEGGKKGQDICGMSAFGVSFFATSIESAEGSLELLAHVMDGMNREVDEKEEDRKGGAGDLGKCLLSASDTNLAIMCHAPKEVAEKLTAADWFQSVAGHLEPQIVSQTEFLISANIPANVEAGKFTLKMRDEAIGFGFAFLRSKGLVPDDDEEDENYSEAAGVDLNAGAALPEEDY